MLFVLDLVLQQNSDVKQKFVTAAEIALTENISLFTYMKVIL